MNRMLDHYISLSAYLRLTPRDLGLTKGEYVLFSLVCGLIRSNGGITTQAEVWRANKTVNKSTTYSLIDQLYRKGHLSKHRPSNQYYSRSYLSLTEKGLLLQARILDALK